MVKIFQEMKKFVDTTKTLISILTDLLQVQN